MARAGAVAAVATVAAGVLVLGLVAPRAEALGTEHLEPSGYIYKDNSLLQPYLSDGITIPNWDFSGSAVVSDEFVRLTPDRQSKRGLLVNKYPLRSKHWEVTIHFHVHGQGKQLFGDGWAFWLTKRTQRIGNVFGADEQFQGLGIFFDTYSNDNAQTQGHPYISALVSDGSAHYNREIEGTNEELAGCQSFFRGVESETYVRIVYRLKTLKLQMEVDGNGWKDCFVADDVNLPRNYYLAVSAETGDLADNHDIINIKVSDIPSLTAEEAAQDKADDQQQQERRAAGAKGNERNPDVPFAKHQANKQADSHTSHNTNRNNDRPRDPVNFARKSKKNRRNRGGGGGMGLTVLYYLFMTLLAVVAVGGVGYLAYLSTKAKKSSHFT